MINLKRRIQMPTPKHVSLLRRVRCFVILLLMGLSLPIQPVFAQTATGALASFGKFLPTDGAKNQSVSLQLRWNSSNSTATDEYCIDTVDNNTCDTAWQTPKIAGLAAVKLEKN